MNIQQILVHSEGICQTTSRPCAALRYLFYYIQHDQNRKSFETKNIYNVKPWPQNGIWLVLHKKCDYPHCEI